MRLDAMAADLDRCARCHEQCLFASAAVLATGRHTLAPSRVALLLDRYREADPGVPPAALAELLDRTIATGLEHAVCLYAGHEGWPDPDAAVRAARADLLDAGITSAVGREAADRIERTGDPFGLGPDRESLLVGEGTLFFVDAATRALAPDVAAASRSIAVRLTGATPLAGVDPLPSSAGYEAWTFGLDGAAHRLADAVLRLARDASASRIVTESPEAVVALRARLAGREQVSGGVEPTGRIEPGRLEVLHLSSWLAGRLPLPKLRRPEPTVAVLHDSARLGRGLGEYEAPRAIAAALGGIELVAPARSRALALPSGPAFGYPDEGASHAVAQRALADLRSTGASLVVTTSAYDRRNLRSAAAALGAAPASIRDLVELVAEALE